jgi:hypothetical protein
VVPVLNFQLFRGGVRRRHPYRIPRVSSCLISRPLYQHTVPRTKRSDRLMFSNYGQAQTTIVRSQHPAAYLLRPITGLFTPNFHKLIGKMI